MDGQSLLSSLSACDPARPRTQYFEIGGKVGLYHDGWFLSGDDGRPSWENIGPGGVRPPIEWTLYDLSRDFSQSADVAAKNPAKLADMQALWRQVAEANNVFPLDHRFATARASGRNPSLAGGRRKHFDFWGKGVSVPANSDPLLLARAFTLKADLVLDKSDASGAVVAVGSRFGGWSLYLHQGRPALAWARSTDPQEMAGGVPAPALPAGATTLAMRFETTRPGAPADVILSANGAELARVRLPLHYLMPAAGCETTVVRRHLGVAGLRRERTARLAQHDAVTDRGAAMIEEIGMRLERR